METAKERATKALAEIKGIRPETRTTIVRLIEGFCNSPDALASVLEQIAYDHKTQYLTDVRSEEK